MCVEDRPKPVVFVETVSASAAGVNTFQSLVFVCSLLCAAGGVSAATALHSAPRGPPQRVQHSNVPWYHPEVAETPNQSTDNGRPTVGGSR